MESQLAECLAATLSPNSSLRGAGEARLHDLQLVPGKLHLRMPITVTLAEHRLEFFQNPDAALGLAHLCVTGGIDISIRQMSACYQLLNARRRCSDSLLSLLSCWSCSSTLCSSTLVACLRCLCRQCTQPGYQNSSSSASNQWPVRSGSQSPIVERIHPGRDCSLRLAR